jgi:hypothetical protein
VAESPRRFWRRWNVWQRFRTSVAPAELRVRANWLSLERHT